MSGCQRVARPITRSLRQELPIRTVSIHVGRPFSQSTRKAEEISTTTTPRDSDIPPPPPPSSASAEAKSSNPLLDPNTTTLRWAEQKLWRQGNPPIGSRRRRAAVRTSLNLPFEQLPYQCFQEARSILAEDRAEKIAAITAEVAKIQRLEQTPADQVNGGEKMKEIRLSSLRRHVERLKILADINDPNVKRRFEDGLGDMNKPIYRHLAERKWRSMAYKIIAQRISQFNIVPDVLPKFDPTVDVQLFFRRLRVPPGEILDSRITEVPPRLKVQVFDQGERLVSVVVMDSDVPDPETDSFSRRCHFLAANVPISPDSPSLPLAKVSADNQLAVPWLPAFSQKGAPYHRMSVFVLEQKPGEKLDVAKLKELYSGRDGFSLKSFRDKFGLEPVGYNIFRSVWDEGTAGVMERAGIPGADVELKRVRVESLKPERKARGWEAKHDKAKYPHLRKYTRRIA